MQLSILILTHNRPRLFARCLTSVLNNLPAYDVEILVNNDTCDITEIQHASVQYFYEKHDDLSQTYQMLFDRATGDFVYFLEDDDYILSRFFDLLDFDYDINFLNYKAADVRVELERIRDGFSVNEYHFQLGQIMFRKRLLKSFPTGNNVHNDWVLFNSISGTTKMINQYAWVQTVDGRDNISFKAYSNDERFIHQAI